MEVGARIAEYEVVDALNPSKPNGEATPLGKGKTSSVYRVRQPLPGGAEIHRALKFFEPSKDVQEKRAAAGLSEGINSFIEEAASLSRFNHQNLVRVIAGGFHSKQQPFLVMDLVEGLTLAELIGGDSLHELAPESSAWQEKIHEHPWLAVQIAVDIFGALEYLHAREFFHMDMAPKNIFLRSIGGGKQEVVVGDLGVGQVITAEDVRRQKPIPIRGTRRYTPQVFHEALNSGKMTADAVRPYAAFWDVFATITILREILATARLDQAQELKGIRIICDQVLHDRRWHTDGTAAGKLAREFSRLTPDNYLTAGVEELSQVATGGLTFISIPLVDVGVTKRIHNVIDHPVFERLRLVPQLLLVRAAHPGGMHMRFEHALGCYELARQYLISLLSGPLFRTVFGPKQLEEALLAVLMCHLGAFPLATAVLAVLPARSRRNLMGTGKSAMRWLLENRYRGESQPLAEVIKKCFPHADLEWVISVVEGHSKQGAQDAPHWNVTRMLIDSSIDVKAVDYIQRDALHTGINAGTNIDVSRIVGALRFNMNTHKLSLARSGVHAVENLLCARLWMYTRVYWGHINRSLFAMVRYTMHYLLNEGSLDKKVLVERLASCDEHDVLRTLNDLWLEHSPPKNRNDAVMPYLLTPRPKFYPCLVELSSLSEGVPASLIRKFWILPPGGLERFSAELVKHVNEMREFPLVGTADLLVDVPQDETARALGGDIEVETDEDGATYEPITRSSEIIRALPKAFENSARRLRVFVSPTYHERLDSTGCTQRLRNVLREGIIEFPSAARRA